MSDLWAVEVRGVDHGWRVVFGPLVRTEAEDAVVWLGDSVVSGRVRLRCLPAAAEVVDRLGLEVVLAETREFLLRRDLYHEYLRHLDVVASSPAEGPTGSPSSPESAPEEGLSMSQWRSFEQRVRGTRFRTDGRVGPYVYSQGAVLLDVPSGAPAWVREARLLVSDGGPLVDSPPTVQQYFTAFYRRPMTFQAGYCENPSGGRQFRRWLLYQPNFVVLCTFGGDVFLLQWGEESWL
jgi:hypothetical protein